MKTAVIFLMGLVIVALAACGERPDACSGQAGGHLIGELHQFSMPVSYTETCFKLPL